MRNKKVIFAITVAILTVVSGCRATEKGQQGSSMSDTLVTESQMKSTETQTETTENVSEEPYSGGLADDGRGEDEIFVSENYIGTWGCGRATLVISENDDGSYFGKITWADSAFAYVEWEYALTYDADSQSMICNGNATKAYYQYEDENTEPTVTVLYTNGSGSFCLSNDVLIWNDMEENKGEDMEFVRSDY